MSMLDYTPMGAAINALSGEGGGGENSSFIDENTGAEIDGAYWACGRCGHTPIRSGDGSCSACGEPVEWDANNPDHQEQ